MYNLRPELLNDGFYGTPTNTKTTTAPKTNTNLVGGTGVNSVLRNISVPLNQQLQPQTQTPIQNLQTQLKQSQQAALQPKAPTTSAPKSSIGGGVPSVGGVPGPGGNAGGGGMPGGIQSFLEQQRKLLNELYQSRQGSEMDAIRRARETALGGLGRYEDLAGQMRYGNKNSADAVHNQNMSRLKEVMASMGLHGGGENVTANVGLMTERDNTMGAIDQDYTNTMNMVEQDRGLINNQAQDQETALIQGLEAQRLQQLLDLETYGQQASYQQHRDSVSDAQFQQQLAAQLSRASSGGSSGGGSSAPNTPAYSTNQAMASINQNIRSRPGSATAWISQHESSIIESVGINEYRKFLAEAQQLDADHNNKQNQNQNQNDDLFGNSQSKTGFWGNLGSLFKNASNFVR